MRQVIAEKLEQQTGALCGARTVEGTLAECRLAGNELVIGIVDIRTDTGWVCIRVSTDEKDYQRARVYEDGQLVESLLINDGFVVYVDDAAGRHPLESGNAAAF